MTPIIFAPYFHIVRIVFRNQHVLRYRLFYGGFVVALIHGTYLIVRAQESSKELTYHSGTIRN
jgi:hypothetical protein